MSDRYLEPVASIRPDIESPRLPEKGIALCLSGGGFRAMLFHLGALWRLQELRFLDVTSSAPLLSDLGPLARVSSVSCGSITSGQLALRWSACKTNDSNLDIRRDAFVREVVTPIRRFAGTTLAGFSFAGIVKTPDLLT